MRYRYEKEFEKVNDVFELQRNLNNAFAYDLVPAPSVIIAALQAARRVNDYPTAVRIFEGMTITTLRILGTPKGIEGRLTTVFFCTTGIKAKVENQTQYDEYVKELQPIRDELGVNLKESMYPDAEAS